jgi:hypothetical protein
MDGLTLLAEAAAAGLVVTADGDRLHIRGPRSAGALARRLIEHKTDVLTLLRLAATDTVDVDKTSTSPEQFQGSVNVNTVNTLTAILAELRRHGLDLIAEPTGRVYLAGPPEAVAVLPTELVEAMEANWQAIKALATPEPAAGLDEIDCPDPCPKCGSLQLWENLLGDWRCQACDPPVRGMKLLELVQRITRKAKLRRQGA